MDMTDSQHLDTYPRTDPDWLAAHWMPYTGNRDFKAHPRLMASAQGAYYTDVNGHRVFDGLSGLWTTGLGAGAAATAVGLGDASVWVWECITPTISQPLSSASRCSSLPSVRAR